MATTTNTNTNNNIHSTGGGASLIGLFDGPTQQKTKDINNNDVTETSHLLLGSSSSNNNNNRNDEEQKRLKYHKYDYKQQQQQEEESSNDSFMKSCCECITIINVPGTWIGSFTFLLYHVVFCLAQASALIRPNATHSSTGRMAQYAALGVWTSGPSFIYQIGHYVPAIYPASDLFLAPFLAQLSKQVDSSLTKYGLENNDTLFFGTFSLLVAIGMILGGSLCWFASKISLANMGNFLPYPVLTGFFSTIGILMWTLGFSVDTDGLSIGYVITSGDWNLIQHSIVHHLPSFIVGIAMHITSKRGHPMLVLVWIFVTIISAYFIMFLTGTTLQQAQKDKWFFSLEDLQGPIATTTTTTTESTTTENTLRYGPEWPFGVWWSVIQGQVAMDAFWDGIPTILALSFLYLLRCSLHSAALKKNIPNVTRTPPTPLPAQDNDEEKVTTERTSTMTTSTKKQQQQQQQQKEPVSLTYLLEHGYAYSQFVSAIVGGITVAPSVAASMTMFHLRAEAIPPQYGSCFLLIFFYWNQFYLVQYIPKPAFSCLMVLAGIDMSRAWLYDSYFKTKAKMEWMVAPFLVVMAFMIGLLNAIFLGIALSTFLFVGSFYRAGTVKFIGNGLHLRSTVERGFEESHWLSQNGGDLIQILVLQNYIFFGNGQSVHRYVTTMFEEVVVDESSSSLPSYAVPEEGEALPIPPVPKHLIIDFSFVTGMDTSAVDVFSEIVRICQDGKCQLYMAGMNTSLKAMLSYAGVRPMVTNKAGMSTRCFSLAFDLETALAKAEDALLREEFHLQEKVEMESLQRRDSIRKQGPTADDGFIYALQVIDEQHGLQSSIELAPLAPYTTVVDLAPGDVLSRDNGLYFVETGLMHVKNSASSSNTTTTTTTTTLAIQSNSIDSTKCDDVGGLDGRLDPTTSIGHLNARSRSLGRQTALWKEEQRRVAALDSSTRSLMGGGGEGPVQSFRLARIGHGWIIGTIEVATHGMKRQGVHMAVSPCRLHHMSVSAVAQVEKDHPIAALHLYKLLAHLSAKRQEMTIDQLGQFVQILNSPTPRLRGGKTGLARLQNQSRLH